MQARHKHSQQASSGDAPIVPVMYLHAPTESGPRELFVGLLEYLQASNYQRHNCRVTRACLSPAQNLPGRDDYC